MVQEDQEVQEEAAQKKNARGSVNVVKKSVSYNITKLWFVEKRKHEAGPQRTGKKKKKAIDTSTKLPNITPSSKCRLRLLRQNRVKDYLLME